MHCFWVGEGNLGNVNGVISSKPGFMEGHEVVELEFNPVLYLTHKSVNDDYLLKFDCL